MYPFWDLVILPTLIAADARKIVEIGALRGDTTVRLIRDLGEGTQLHVIDPVPDFDPSKHETRFPGQYVFHRDLSLNVLDDIPPMDAALIDGDHNWYTVINEMRSLARVANDAGRPMPVMLLHDVGWPYGRRDLYYDPSNVPPEGVRDHRRAGISRVTDELKEDGGGFNKSLCNAVDPGGPRNGVMTAVEDFLEEYPRPVRMVVLPIYYGLAIVAEETTLEAQPALAELLDHLESNDGKEEVLRLSEEIRLDAVNVEQNFQGEYLRRIDDLSTRYMALVKSGIAGTLAPEQELRIDHLLEAGGAPSPEFLRDPIRTDRPRSETLARRHRNGGSPTEHGAPTAIGSVAVDLLDDWLVELDTTRVRGDLVHCGSDRGGVAVLFRAHLDARFDRARTVWVVDTFDATTPGDHNTVRDTLSHYGLLDDRVRFLTGRARDALADSPLKRAALVHVGEVDDLAETLAVLHRRLADGGRIIVETGGDPAKDSIVDDFTASLGATAARPTDRLRTWTKSEEHAVPARVVADVPPASIPLLDDETATKDLTMVVVFYDMRREAARTLRSLSRSYQEGIEDLDYEVLVIDNGSPGDGALEAEFVESFGPEFVLHSLGDDATASPTTALNHGIAHAHGAVVGLMVDGAHVLTPGVLRHALVGMESYAPAAVATQPWYIGPGQQSEVMAVGWDQAAEDRMFTAIEWPDDGYKLFDIGHFQGGRDWLSGMWESNCLFVSRATLRQVGGFDDSFDEPGGEYCNLEIFERVNAAPDITMVTLLGEGSFHQVHGGTTSNQPSPEERFARIERYRDRYEALRGRPFLGPRKIVHYVGTIRHNSRRSMARRMAARRFFRRGQAGDPEGPPDTPTPIPEELATEYLDAYWASASHRRTRWLGHDVPATADDLLAYQRLIVETRPESIIVTSTDGFGRALYFATVCELLGHGSVIAVDTADEPTDAPPVEHPRLTILRGDPATDDATAAAIRERVEPLSAMVVIGSGGYRDTVAATFDALAGYVAVGGYGVVEWTALNGHPVWPSYGPGPAEAVKLIRKAHPDLIEDPTAEAAGPSLHRGGYLRRTRAPA